MPIFTILNEKLQMKKLALHWQILLGMAFGVLFAFLLIQFEWGKDVIVN